MDKIPADAIQEILTKLPTKSLLRFKCVSKSWCSMIEDPVFVDAFRVRSHNRSPCLLIRKNHHGKLNDRGVRKVNDFFLVDLKGNSAPLPVPSYLETLTFPFEEVDGSIIKEEPFLHFVEGLACINNIIWNPTTRKIMDLPPRKLNQNVHVRKVNEDTNIVAGSYIWCVSAEYSLGFDYSTREYKVLSISRTGSKINHGIGGRKNAWDTTDDQVYAEVLTLGTNSWRNTNFSLPQELEPDFSVVTNCTINGIIYLVIYRRRYRYEPPSYCLLNFDLSNEKFQLLPIPKGFDYSDHACEVGERFALIEQLSTKIWILQDSGSGKWTEEDFLWPQDWYTNLSYDNNRPVIDSCIEPIGSCPTGDILFKRLKFKFRLGEEDDEEHSQPSDEEESQPSTCVCYDMKLKSARTIPELNGVIYPNTRYDWDDICIKHVETIHPLK
ncbi:putative F-box protein At1g47790 [Coffea arabica]|uniref:F-box protein At1g47790 n=1 Tax=Coffea arabica TaxID=13443 RepID=A0A6P6V0G4_COFAR|nr:putative F-box protein At1g47790 [Coffea arabica]